MTDKKKKDMGDDIHYEGLVTMRKGSIQQQWGDIEDEYFVEDNVGLLVERIQDKYGGTKEDIFNKIKEIAEKEEKEKKEE